MRKTWTAKLTGMLLCVTLIAGNAADFGVYAKEETVSGELAEQIQEPSGGVLPAEIEQISKAEAEELQELFAERDNSGEYNEPEINSGYSSDYGYSTLSTPQQQACYSQLKTAAYSFHNEYKEAISRSNSNYVWGAFDFQQYNFTDVTQIQQVLFAVEADCPELFWLTGNFSYSISQGKIINFYPAVSEDYAAAETRQETQEGIEQGLVSYLQAIDTAKAEGKTDMQIEMMIHDMIISAIDYAYVPGTKTPQDAGYAHSIDGVFNGTEAVCEGYAKAFHLLANYAGIDSIYAVGYGDGGGHAWNLVCLDGEWYNIDVTWDDLGSGTYHDGVRYLYYNCDTSSFGDHVYVASVFPGMYDVPETVADTYNYYNYYHLNVTEQDVKDEAAFAEFMKRAISGCSERQDYLLQIRSENSTVLNEALNMISQYGRSILAEASTSESVYRNTGSYFYATTGGYIIYYPMVCIYADSYQIPYNSEGAQLAIHVVKGRNEITQEGNYTISYSGNQQLGTAQAFISGEGDYAFLGTSILEFTILADSQITNIPTPAVTVSPEPTETPLPTDKEEEPSISPEPTETPIPTVEEKEPSNTPKPTETPLPTDKEEEPSISPEPTETPIPTAEEKEPSNTPKPTTAVIPTWTEVQPSITPIPTVTTAIEPSIAPKSTATAVPTITQPSAVVPHQVTGVKFVSGTNTKVTISFKKQQGVSGYEVSLWKGSRQVKSAVTTSSRYTFKNLSAGTDYKVKVRAFHQNQGKKTYGVYSKSVKAATATKAPSIKSVKGKKGQAVIQWKKVKNADGYQVYMSGKKNSGYKKTATITSGAKVKYTKKKLTPGKTYYFKIRTYRKIGGKKVYSSYSKIVKNSF